jgi:acetyltransferase-like isoleucine patch superfamily enzyme
VRRDHRPYLIKRTYLKFEKSYTRHFLKPHFEQLGRGYAFMRPWHVEVFGSPVKLGDFATVIATPDKKVRFSVWPSAATHGAIGIGRYALICPGVRISSAARITIGDNCMMANNVYVTDADWHGIYDRVDIGSSAPVIIADNVWLGDSAIVCKGVSIGENSIVGAGAVVVGDVPANAVVGGNPARVIKTLDPDQAITTRGNWFSDPARLSRDFAAMDRAMLGKNSLFGWLRYLLFPNRND